MIKQEDKAEIEKIKKLPLKKYVEKILPGGEMDTELGVYVLTHKDNSLHKLSIPIGNIKNFTSRNRAWESAGYLPEND